MFLPQPRAWTFQREDTSLGCPDLFSLKFPPSLQDFFSPLQRWGRKSSPTLGTCTPRGPRDFGGTGLLPPHPQPAACASLGTKQSLLSNFKCYLRTAWPQPKTALWKLAFRCRGCKYQRHTFGGGGCFSASPPSVAGAGPERTHRHTDTQKPPPTEGHTLCCGLHTRCTTAVHHSTHPNTHNTYILTHQEGEGRVFRVLHPHGPWNFSSW